jgi:hypothetical protein
LVRTSQPTASGHARQEEIRALTKMATGLRSQLAEIMDRIEKLEKEN